MQWPAWDVFITSPGAGGMGALVAALVVGGSALWVSRHRQRAERLTIVEMRARRRADMRAVSRSQTATERHNAQERWWERFVWLVNATNLTVDARIGLLERMSDEALELGASGLVRVAKAWTEDLYRQL